MGAPSKTAHHHQKEGHNRVIMSNINHSGEKRGNTVTRQSEKRAEIITDLLLLMTLNNRVQKVARNSGGQDTE